MTIERLDAEELGRRLAPLLERGSVPADSLELKAEQLSEFGFLVRDGVASLPEGIERLDAALIRNALTQKASDWLKDLVTLEVVGSTSSLLNELAAVGSVDGQVRLAELQVQGRGRRGRHWISPYANNLALSLGARLPQTPDQLGGFSLCVGLAVADRLQAIGLPGVELKWPNDVLLDGRKLAGILIELHSKPEGTEVVIGIGINFKVPAAARALVDQPITDLAASGETYSRNLIAGGLISSLVDFIDGFAMEGFLPMKSAFNRLHRFHGQECTLIIGDERLVGVVRGVTEGGELLLELEGQLHTFHSGEVSLRPLSPG